MKDLKVEVPHRFKKQLKRRFSYENRQVNGNHVRITVSCTLCRNYLRCKDCPFGKWARRVEACCCRAWLVEALGETPRFKILLSTAVEWTLEDDEKVKHQLERLHLVAEQAIKWV